MLDPIDMNILEELKKNSRAPLKYISSRVSLSVPAVGERIRKMERNGYIKQYTLKINTDLINNEHLFFCLITTTGNDSSIGEALRNFAKDHNELLECHRILGEYEYILKVCLPSERAIEPFLISLREEIGIKKSVTFTVLSSLWT
ncbi:MAG: Lrp/AsnC family transcriptional regulator [Clostridiales bacterium]|nr:Lrp/AsnC family transcriptional regulator [Clostridiales bacterium]MDD7347198.1 Lrp/AsnC family transcriptional regulator [Clostridiales bacterium]MDY4060978.1 Lrp/AsnC family transcriptional regulator [Anaerovoracaceae bacterium]